MESFSLSYLLVAGVAVALAIYALLRGFREEDRTAQGIGGSLLVLAWFISSPGPLGFAVLLMGLYLFKDDLSERWAAWGITAKAPPTPKGGAKRRPPPPRGR